MLSVLCLLAFLATGTVEAIHVHPSKPLTPGHSCSICASHNVGVRTESVSLAPTIAESPLLRDAGEVAHGYRTVFSIFVRPPPAA